MKPSDDRGPPAPVRSGAAPVAKPVRRRTTTAGVQLALLPHCASPPIPGPDPAPGRPLWMSVWLPHLALDGLVRTGETRTEPLIIVESGHRPRVHDANRAARRAGAFPGMALTDALAILNAPAVIEYRPETARANLETLAAVLLQFSDHVCPEPEHARILLEIGRSLRLFRGADALRKRVLDTLRRLGYSPRIGAARTPAAARLLATAGLADHPADRDALRRTLSPLPLTMLPLPGSVIDGLHAVGLVRVGELLRLPRADLTLRHGPALPDLLDRLLGDLPETLPRFQPTEHPEFRLQFDREVSLCDALLFPLKRLLQQMEQALRARHRSVQEQTLRLVHRDSCTTVTLARSRPGGRAGEWLELWGIRLSRLELPAPVLGMRLEAERLLSATGETTALFGGTMETFGDSEIVARMRARLGEDSVLRFTPTLHPLPERAQAEWVMEAPDPTAPERTTPAQHTAGAALWLTSTHSPQPFSAPTSAQWLGRLEGGWWADGNDQRRDYALARDRNGRLCWVFRDLRSGEWRLQGLWG